MHFVPDGVFAPATLVAGVPARAEVAARATVVNDGAVATASADVRFDVFDAAGGLVASATAHGGPLAPGATATVAVDATLSIPTPQLWSQASPYLYAVRATLVPPGTAAVAVVPGASAAGDTVNVSVGVRNASWTADNGFFLNGRHTSVDCHAPLP